MRLLNSFVLGMISVIPISVAAPAAESTVEKQFNKAEVVFTATIEHVYYPKQGKLPSVGNVQKVWKGDVPANIDIVGIINMECINTIWSIQRPREWLVFGHYAERNDKKVVETDPCDGTKPRNEADDEIKSLGPPKVTYWWPTQ